MHHATKYLLASSTKYHLIVSDITFIHLLHYNEFNLYCYFCWYHNQNGINVLNETNTLIAVWETLDFSSRSRKLPIFGIIGNGIITDIIKFDGEVLETLNLVQTCTHIFEKKLITKIIIRINVLTIMINKLEKLSHKIVLQKSQSYKYPKIFCNRKK